MKLFVRKIIKAACALIVSASFWVPFCVYVATREIVPSLIALAFSVAIAFGACIIKEG